MAAFLVVGYSGVLNGCTWFDSAQRTRPNLDQQIAKYQAAVKTDPQDATAWNNLGQQLEYRANQEQQGSAAQKAYWVRAAEAYAKADAILAEQKGKAAKATRLEVLGRLVDIQLFLQDYQAATGVYGRITELTPKDPQAFFDMATVAINAGDTNTALLALHEVPRARSAVAGRTAGQGMDRAELPELHTNALSIADQVRGPVHE